MSLEAASKLLNQLEKVLWLVTAQSGSVRGGLIATFVQNASLVPELPRLVLGIANHHHTWKLIEESGNLGVHLLSGKNVDLVWRFGIESGWTSDTFRQLQVVDGRLGVPILPDCLASMECHVEAGLETGDRTVYVAQIVTAEIRSNGPPLTLNEAMQVATPSQRQSLLEQRERDIQKDAEAIRNWRQSRLQRPT